MYRFCFVLLCIWGQFSKCKPPGGLYLRGDLTEGFLRYRFGGLIFWGAYTWRGLFSEFYGMFTLYWTAIARARKPHRMGFLFTHKNGDFCGKGAKLFHTDLEGGASPISYRVCARTAIHLDGIKYSGLRTGIYLTEPSRPTAPASFSMCVNDLFQFCAVAVHTIPCSHYTTFTPYRVHTIPCSLYTVFTPYRVHSIPCSHYTVFTLYCVHTIPCSLYTLFTPYRVHTIPCSHYTVLAGKAIRKSVSIALVCVTCGIVGEG